ncbi:hypothetical protein PHJA_001738800 [Phtheirospermum japonicum]|uniref:Uncharacterized protein n=1 Tax=Phtheirospermum japonicum TaxID=374723 RepID=A0A830C5F6_9LAMI|nr:hypothetical protein PHJA_001738800 [Phtheirospermum japonicum]
MWPSFLFFFPINFTITTAFLTNYPPFSSVIIIIYSKCNSHKHSVLKIVKRLLGVKPAPSA